MSIKSSPTNRRSCFARTVAVIAGLAPSVAIAQTFNESGDAGVLIPGAATVGAGALTRINGTLNSVTDIDLYAIRITNPAAFSATTVGQTAVDTQLFLFDAAGRGVVGCDDAAAGVFQSTIGGPLVTVPGVYYLLISSFDNDPTSNGQQMWNDTPYIGQRSPDGPGGGPTGQLDGYSLMSGSTGAYGINLTGAEFIINTAERCQPNLGPEQFTSTGDAPSDLVIADFSRDGLLDIVTSNYNSNNVSLLRGNGNGTFQAAQNFTMGTAPNAIAMGDLNRDGGLDIVTANFGSGNITVRLGTNTGFIVPVNFAAGGNPVDVEVADVNRDGSLDILVLNQASVNMSVLIGNGAGGFAAAVNYTTTAQGLSLALGDLDPDGILDVYVGTVSGVYLLRGQVGGGFNPPVQIANQRADGIAIGDLNGDSQLDIAYCTTSTDTLSLLFNNGASSTFNSAGTFPTDDAPASVVIADVNDDGVVDVSTAHNATLATHVYYGGGGGSFYDPGYPIFLSQGTVAFADVNRDGTTDFISPLFATDQISVATQSTAPLLPGVFIQPSSTSVLAGQTAFFSAAPTNSLPLRIQWRRNGVPMTDGPNVSGVTSTNLVITDVTLADNGAVFDCVFTNVCGSTTTRCVSLTVANPCPADFDGSGTIAVPDVFAFLSAWFAGCP